MSVPDWRQACGYLEEYYYSQLAKGEIVDINQAFPSKYLKASDLQGKTLKVTIENVSRIDDDGELKGKLCMTFVGKDKGMILNKTNAMNLAGTYGPETEGWKGKEIVLFSETVQFQGQPTAALRVRPHQEVELDDSVPF